MKDMTIFLLVLAACGRSDVDEAGRPMFAPRFVAAEYRALYEEARKQINSNVGYEALAPEGSGWHAQIVVDDGDLKQVGEDLGRPIVGINRDQQITLRSISSGPADMARTQLFHEIGHALGLKHSSRGIMRRIADSYCVGTEAECIANEMHAQGLLD